MIMHYARQVLAFKERSRVVAILLLALAALCLSMIDLTSDAHHQHSDAHDTVLQP